jgi:hypothetical protein
MSQRLDLQKNGVKYFIGQETSSCSNATAMPVHLRLRCCVLVTLSLSSGMQIMPLPGLTQPLDCYLAAAAAAAAGAEIYWLLVHVY